MPKKRLNTLDDAKILQAAIAGLEVQRQQLDEQIAELRARLAALTAAPSAGVRRTRVTRTARKKKVLSPEARRRIAEAQRRRWAEYHRRMAQAAQAEAQEAGEAQPSDQATEA